MPDRLGRSTPTKKSTRRATRSSTSTQSRVLPLQITPNLYFFVENLLRSKGNVRITKMIQEDAATKKKTSSTQEKVQRLIARKKTATQQRRYAKFNLLDPAKSSNDDEDQDDIVHDEHEQILGKRDTPDGNE